MKRKKGYGYRQGKYTPVNKDKYVGSYPIRYLSSWELKAFVYLDKNEQVINWASESLIVKYVDPTRKNTTHRYFVDLSLTTKEGEKIQKYFIEIKPAAQCKPPVRGRKAQKTFINESITWVRNKAKWNAAVKVAMTKGAKFAVWTEENFTVLN